ncbi:MAG: hypothetical protein JXR53_03235 [Bacteroidales bacterium]|nr:hypothetical protein [Bacteroidales bacterium]
MKKILISILFIAILFGVNAQVNYSPPSGYFKINFPSDVTIDQSEMEVSTGNTILYTFMAMDESENLYMVSYADYPGDVFKDKSLHNNFMEKSVEGFFGEMNATPQNRTNIKAKKYKGLEYRGQNTDYSIIYRVFIAKNTVFQLVIVGMKSYPSDTKTNSFFKSFKITL